MLFALPAALLTPPEYSLDFCLPFSSWLNHCIIREAFPGPQAWLESYNVCNLAFLQCQGHLLFSS